MAKPLCAALLLTVEWVRTARSSAEKAKFLAANGLQMRPSQDSNLEPLAPEANALSN